MTTARRALVVATLALTACGEERAPSIDPARAPADFASTETLLQGPQFHSATLLPDGRVLVAGGPFDAVAATIDFDPRTGGFSSAGAPPIGRRQHAAVLLRDGRVFFAGGFPETDINAPALATTSLLDPTTGALLNGPKLAMDAKHPVATRLLDGEVLIVAEGEAQLFDPVAGTLSSPIALADPTRRDPTAVRLASGRVLFVGGNGDGTQRAEIFDPKTRAFAFTAATTAPRSCASALLLPPVAKLPKPASRYALVVGGGCAPATEASAEVFDEDAGTFAPLASTMSAPRARSGLTLLPSGYVVALGGGDGAGQAVGDAEVLDLEAMTFTLATSMPPPPTRDAHTDTLLATGEDLAIGGSDSSQQRPASTFSLPRDGVLKVSPIVPGRDDEAAVRLRDGRVFIAGGAVNDGQLSTTEIFDPATRSFSKGPDLDAAGSLATATLLDDGRVLIAGGRTNSAMTGIDSAYVVDFSKKASGEAKVLKLPSPRGGHAAALLPSGEVLLVGGFDDNATPLDSAIVFDPKHDSFRGLDAKLPIAVDFLRAAPLPSGDILIVGGDSLLASRYDVRKQKFVTTAGAPTEARHPTSLLLLPSGLVLVAGRRDRHGLGFDVTYDLYDPATDAFSPFPAAPIGHLHGATLLASGRVLLMGEGPNGAAGVTLSPTTKTYEPIATPTCYALGVRSLILLATGDVLDLGCAMPTTDARLWSEFPGRRQLAPTVAPIPTPIAGGAIAKLTGARLDGLGEGSTGRTQSSPADVPIAVWMPNGRGGAFFGGITAWTDTTASWRAPVGPLRGSGLLFVIENGAPGVGAPFEVALAENGTRCESELDCASGFCADGVCCDAACTAVCEACTATKKGSGADGACGPIARGSDPEDECAAQLAETCGQTGSCDGAGRCELFADDTPCAGAGHCKAGACIGATCASNLECPSGEICTSAGLCAPLDAIPGAPSAIGCASSPSSSRSGGVASLAFAFVLALRRARRVSRAGRAASRSAPLPPDRSSRP